MVYSPARIRQLSKMTEELGGTYREFCQDYSELVVRPPGHTNDASKKDTEIYVGGPCHALSLFWVAGRLRCFKRDPTLDLFKWLMPQGAGSQGNRHVNQSALQEVISQTIRYKAKGAAFAGLNLDEFDLEKDFLIPYGLKDLAKPISGYVSLAGDVSGIGGVGVFSLKYKSRTSGAHCCAAISSQKGDYVYYFDPMYGEAYIPTRSMFKDWWTKYDNIVEYQRTAFRGGVSGKTFAWV